MNPHTYLAIAGSYAIANDLRNYWIGAVGIRSDGTLVHARSGAATYINFMAHAEARIIKKIDAGATVFITRISKLTGQWALAKPCSMCYDALRFKGVKKVFYTIGPNEYGCFTGRN